MADHVISLSESVNVFGLAPSTKWNEFSWGVGKWGEGDIGLVKSVGKYLSETETITETLSKAVIKVIGDTETIDMAMTNTELRDSAGYSYVYPGPTTDSEAQARTTWTEVTFTNPTWTSGSVRGTSWS